MKVSPAVGSALAERIVKTAAPPATAQVELFDTSLSLCRSRRTSAEHPIPTPATPLAGKRAVEATFGRGIQTVKVVPRPSQSLYRACLQPALSPSPTYPLTQSNIWYVTTRNQCPLKWIYSTDRLLSDRLYLYTHC